MNERELEDVWRRESPHVLAALLRRHGDLADCEDAAQEALEAAAKQWDPPPENPRGWLITVASRRLIDRARADAARADRELEAAAEEPPPAPPGRDDSLELLLLCCHPALSRTSQVALTLRAVSGLSTAEIAAAFLVPEATMGQRLSRARATLREAGARFGRPAPDELPARVAAVLDVLYLVFNEGYTRSAGDALLDGELTREAIRLTRELGRALPDHDEVAGALALMLLTQAREPARADARGDLVPLADQDRSRWRREEIAEGVAILERVLPARAGRALPAAGGDRGRARRGAGRRRDRLGPDQALYDMLERVAPGPAVTLNRAVAVGMASGPAAGLTIVDGLLQDPRMARHHRTHAVRAHLLELAGDRAGAAQAYERAAALTASLPEQRYLNRRAAEARR